MHFEIIGKNPDKLLRLADNRGALRLVAASTEQARMELFQIQNDEGPCLDCYRTGRAVIVSDIRADRAAPS